MVTIIIMTVVLAIAGVGLNLALVKTRVDKIEGKHIVESFLVGAVVGAVYMVCRLWVLPMWLLILFFIVLIGVMCAGTLIPCFDKEDGVGNFTDTLPIIGLAVVYGFAAWAALKQFADVSEGNFPASLAMTIPIVMLVAMVGLSMWALVSGLSDMDDTLYGDDRVPESDRIDRETYEARKQQHRSARVIIAILMALLVALAFVLPTFADSFSNKAEEPQEETISEVPAETKEVKAIATKMKETSEEQKATNKEVEEAVKSIWHYYHYDCRANDTLADDFNFGPSAYISGATAQDIMNLQFKRGAEDPALGVCMMAMTDVEVGLDFTGKFFDESWSVGQYKTFLNEKVAYFNDHPEEYKAAFNKLEKFYRTYAKAELVRYRNIKNQMYMSSDTGDIPKLVVMESEVEECVAIKYTFDYEKLISASGEVLPGAMPIHQDGKIYYRLECGFQPLDIAEKIKETPEPNPNKPDSPETPTNPPVNPPTTTPTPTPTTTPEPTPTTTPTPTPTTTPEPTPTVTPKPTPTVTPTPTPTDPPKNPTQGTPGMITYPGTNPNEGESTNNGEGAQTSAADQKNSSTSYSAPKGAQKEAQRVQEAKETQKVGGDSNAASSVLSTSNTSTMKTDSESVKQDNNANQGTGSGDADKSTTEKKETEVVAGKDPFDGHVSDD